MSQQYDTLTDTLNNYISTQVATESDWTSLAGGLTKVSASSAGNVWGYSGSTIYACQLPCSGNWVPVSYSGGTVSDLTTDDTNVYVLSGSTLYIKTANNTSEWVSISTPIAAVAIFQTQSYLWIEDGSNAKYRLAKPGTTGNWIGIPDTSNVRLTSASATSLYGVDPLGTAMKSDESLQSKWSAVPEFAGKKVERVVGDIDTTALYSIDSSNQVMRCSGGCAPVSTKGYVPSSLTVEPSSRNVWMTTVTPGLDGNVFTRPDTPGFANLSQTVTPIDTQRDAIAKNAKQSFDQSTKENTVGKQLEAIKTFLSKHFSINNSQKNKNNAKKGGLRDQITNTNATISQLNASEPILQTILILLGIVILIYLFGSFLGWFVHLLACLVMGGGLIYIIVVQNKNGSTSL